MAYNGLLNSSNPVAAYMDLATGFRMEAEYLYGLTPLSPDFGNPQAVDYFVREIKRASWFTMIPINIRTVNGVMGFGQTFSFTTNNIGEYLTKLWLNVTTPAVTLLSTNRYTTNGRLRWCRKFMHNLIEDCNITFNETMVARLDNYILDFNSQFLLDTGKETIYDQMIGDYEALTGSHGPTTPLGATIPSQYLHLPLPFFFTRDSGVSLPLAALPFNQIKFNFKFRDWSQMLILDDSGASGAGTVARSVPTVGIDIAAVPVLQNIELWGTIAIVNAIQRNLMAESTRDIIIENFQRESANPFSVVDHATGYCSTYKPKFTFAVSAIFFGARNTTFPNEWSNYATNSPYNSGNTVQYTPASSTNPIEDITVNYESTTRLTSMKWGYYSKIQPYNHCPISPRDIGYGIYSYAISLANFSPNGSTNFSKLNNVEIYPSASPQAQIAGTGSDIATSGADFPQTFSFIMLAKSYNVIRVQNGQLTFPYV